ncbi:hypothetical protein [Tautonia plasticadhaerens]|uniref:Uncharacterized protein n=1 Tax=Tautonia plasticadhaerens TaxID=2527974 RepID=A0A518H065_9BACT|nr:hypothetical protein [Tautonia plasticadhaerens]QDV34230.1 hypothetical protein ElP_21150 [Tautonia plasticadhaerens]
MTRPCVEFLVLDAGECWERVGRLQRIRSIKHEYYGRPDALRLSFELMEPLAPLFRAANPDFNFFGPTEFEGEAVDALVDRLGCDPVTPPGRTSRAIEDAVRAIADLARLASESGKVLLVLGI